MREVPFHPLHTRKSNPDTAVMFTLKNKWKENQKVPPNQKNAILNQCKQHRTFPKAFAEASFGG